MSNSKRPVTHSYHDDGDISYLFRSQDPRTLAEIDTLLQRQFFLRSVLGNSKADEIE